MDRQNIGGRREAFFKKEHQNGMCGHPARNAFDLVSSIRRFLNSNTFSCTTTRNGPIHHVLEDMGVAVIIMRSILDRVRMIQKGSGVPPRVVRLSNLKDMRKKGMKHCSLSRVTIGECLVPHVESSFFWFTDVEITQDNAHSIGIRRKMWIDETQSFT